MNYTYIFNSIIYICIYACFAETFCHNPQYRITLEYPDDDDDKCTVIVALMQKNRRAQKRMGADCLTIGFAIYHVCEINWFTSYSSQTLCNILKCEIV